MKRLLGLILILFYSVASYTQNDTLDVYLERLIEAFIENNDGEEFDYANSFELLEEIRKRPYDINTVTEEQLSNLFFLSPIQRQDIVTHRNEYGDYLALEELQNINSLDNDVIKILHYYLTVVPPVNDQFSFRDIGRGGTNTLFLKYKNILQEKKGYRPNDMGVIPYLGDRNHYFVRYKYESNNNFRIGFTAEKDAGEEFFKGSNKQGFDYYSGYVMAQNINRQVKQIIVGDYTLSFGQGLILHNDFGAGKSAFVMNIKKGGRTIRPYSSVNETNYFRGIGITTTPFKNSELTLLFSNKKIDANVNRDTNDIDGFETASSIIRDGFHRTPNEIAKRGSITQTNYGGKLSYQIGRLTVTGQYLAYTFSNIYRRSDALYNIYTFNGKTLQNMSVGYNYMLENLNVFGEIARSDNGGTAQIHSMLLPVDKKIDFALSYRNFTKDYQVLEANAFSEASLPINEEAIYAGVEIRPNNAWKFSSYVDFWKNPWLKFRVDAPYHGKEILARIEYNIKRKFNAYLQYRYEVKGINSSLPGNKIDVVTPVSQHRVRIHMAHKINKEIELRARAEANFHNKDFIDKQGYLVYQDIIYKPIGRLLSFTARYAVFDTDGFDTRIYAYENDILYEFAIPFFSNSGQRAYLNLRYKLARNFTLEGRYAITKYERLKTIGSGNELINGDVRSDVKFQIRYNF